MSESETPPPVFPSQPAVHVPVLTAEVLLHLALEPGLTVADGTVGAGGHAQQILDRIGKTGRLIGLDRDPQMLDLAARRLSTENCSLRQANYADLPNVLKELNLETVDRILLDLGLSSDQLADRSRSFSFDSSGPLDLRFDRTQGEPTWQMLRRLDARELARILEEYGEFPPPLAGRIAEGIASVVARGEAPTGRESSEAILQAMPKKVRQSSRKRPETRVFQALRIAANDELAHLQRALAETLPTALVPGGRLVVISFHSLEDRLVKRAFHDDPRWQKLTSKPVTATPAEVRANPRARSAKLRAAMRTE